MRDAWQHLQAQRQRVIRRKRRTRTNAARSRLTVVDLLAMQDASKRADAIASRSDKRQARNDKRARRRLKRAQKRYSATEREACRIVGKTERKR